MFPTFGTANQQAIEAERQSYANAGGSFAEVTKGTKEGWRRGSRVGKCGQEEGIEGKESAAVVKVERGALRQDKDVVEMQAGRGIGRGAERGAQPALKSS